MQITAKLIELLPLLTGTSSRGEWKKQNFIMETDAQYPKKMCFSIWNEKIDLYQLQVGNELTLDFDIESRESKGNWYTELKVWKVQGKNTTAAVVSQLTVVPLSTEMPKSFELEPHQDVDDDDGLPF
jgi:hypothetical protein